MPFREESTRDSVVGGLILLGLAVTNAFRRGVYEGLEPRPHSKSCRDVTNAFRREVYEGPKHGFAKASLQYQSPMPFGEESTRDTLNASDCLSGVNFAEMSAGSF